MKNDEIGLAEEVAKQAVGKIEHERSFAWDLLAEFKRTNQRMFVIILVLIGVLVASNFYWLYTFTCYDFVSYQQDGAGINNADIGGDVYNGTESFNKEEKRQ